MIVAKLNDVVKARVQNPVPGTYIVTLLTPASVAYANEVLNAPNTGWWLEPASSVSELNEPDSHNGMSQS